ncbi:cobalamin-binding protein [Rhizobium sp. RU36D]|uniref:cobalamin B12-binding domain-containing protein n=1 Tax=Rhizobium sp. RU36D TaxID=1907415 RepID=UPI0009D8BC11|nr:cobalamin-binding protein [Rhizobium sp. RU36D]SMC53650.1 hypothetical protein SAMN05880593_102275 [Rhizobium sp. RU36D]
MTAERLASRYDIGLEHDNRYSKALASFCDLVVRPGVRTSMLLDFLRRELPSGEPEFVKYLFIETTARQLGSKWISDDCDFVDVTIGAARLQELIKLLSFQIKSLHSDPNAPLAVLLTPFGEQHTLMQHMLGLLFDAMGWSTHLLDGREPKDPYVCSLIEQADVVCIGWSNQQLKGAFGDLVSTVRSCRPDSRVPIVVGGAAALDSIDFLVGLGIDCICDSVYSATRICERFFELETISRRTKASGRRAAVNASGLDGLVR